MTYGIHPILEALKTDKDIEKLYIQKDFESTPLEEIESLAKSKGVAISRVPHQKLDKLSKYKNHQGVVASISPISYADFEITVNRSLQKDKPPFFLLLDQLTDVRNFGAIIRTAECCGVTAIVVPKTGSAPINGDTVKTSAGAVFNIPICKVDHIKDAIYYMNASNIDCVAATEKAQQTIYDVDFTKPLAIIMGSEGRGINPSILKIVETKAKLPLVGQTESLNVSVACGAILFEAVRQRN